MGQLGLNAREHKLLPAFVAGREVLGGRIVASGGGALRGECTDRHGGGWNI